MTRQLSSLMLVFLSLFSMTSYAAEPVRYRVPSEITVIGYHEIIEPSQALIPQYAVSPENMDKQLAGLKDHGFHFVSINDLLMAHEGKKPLPEKAILLTFDDGYRSFYDNAYPILKKYNAPAVLALVGSWLKPAENQTVDFAGKPEPRNKFFSWDQLHEMEKSGLIELGSHTYHLHDGIQGNPQGNTEPAVTTHYYDPKTKKYETDQHYRMRIYNDLKENNELLRTHGLKTPRVMIWPYGSYNAASVDIAASLGMPITLTLDDGENTSSTPMDALRRILMDNRMSTDDLLRDVREREEGMTENNHPQKIMHVDLDYIYDKDPVQQEKNLGDLLDRIQAMHVNAVYLQAFADPNADGSAEMVYFPNRHMPMRADLFNRVSWQIATRTQVRRVYAWMPMLAWDLPAKDPAAKDLVVTQQKTGADHLNMGYHRLTPFSPRARQTIKEIYEDLGKSATFDGILYHDDVTLSDYEDASPEAMAQYKAAGLPADLNAVRADEHLLQKWTSLKTKTLDGFAQELSRTLRQYQPALLTARNLYAQPALRPYAENWYSQSLEDSIKNYDFTAIEAMPYMEQAPDQDKFFQDMFNRVKQIPNGINKTVFELQAVNWRTDKKIPSEELANTIAKLYSMGVKHVGYYPDDVAANHPDPKTLRQVFDTKSSDATP